MAMIRMPWRRSASRQTLGAYGPSSLSVMASRPHGPVTSTSSHAGTSDAVATTDSPRWRAATAHWNSTRCDHSLDRETVDDDALRGVVEAGQAGDRHGRRCGQQLGQEGVRLRRQHELVIPEAERALS